MGDIPCFHARRQVSPHPLLSQGMKTPTACCFSTTSSIFLPTSPYRTLPPSHIAKVCGPPSCYLAGFYRLSPITVFGPLHEAFCSRPFSSGVFCCTSHPHPHPHPSPDLPTFVYGWSQECRRTSHSLPHPLFPALQLSSN